MPKAAAKTVKLLKLGRSTSFIGRGGREVEMKEPDGPATEGQVMSLYRKGHLVITAEPQDMFDKAEASWALTELNGD